MLIERADQQWPGAAQYAVLSANAKTVVILAGRGGPALLLTRHLPPAVPPTVVILAGRGGPALPKLRDSKKVEPEVVILAGRGGPALRGRPTGRCAAGTRCDPRRARWPGA